MRISAEELNILLKNNVQTITKVVRIPNEVKPPSAQMAYPSIAIRVDVNKKEKLLHPIVFENQIITDLGIYIENGVRVWVLRKETV